MYPNNNSPDGSQPPQPYQSPDPGYQPPQPPAPQDPYGQGGPGYAVGSPAGTDQSAPQQPPPMQAPAWQPKPPLAPGPAGYVPPDPAAQLPQPQQSPIATDPGYGQGGGGKKALLVVVILLVLGLVAAGGYYVVNMLDKKTDTSKTNTAIEESKSKSEAQPLDKLKGVTLLPPHDLTEYTANDANTATSMSYATADGSCHLELGIYDAVTLPGTDLADIVAKQLDSLRKQGVTIPAPVSGEPLELKDATDGDKQYTLPTLTFTATQDSTGTHIRSHYSAAVMEDDKRAFVTRVCQSKSGPVSEETLKKIDADANDITVRL
jgi:hypothetical protein